MSVRSLILPLLAVLSLWPVAALRSSGEPGGRKLVIPPNGSDNWASSKPQQDNTPIKAFARAHR